MNVQQYIAENNLQSVFARAMSFAPQNIDRLLQVQVVWNNRLSSCAGRAVIASNTIELNPRLKNLNRPEEPNATFLHELAHFMAFFRHGKMDHSAFWWEAMFQLGQWPRRTHSFGKAMKAEVLTLADLGLE